MNCLKQEQLMELLYREGEPENLKQYKEHIMTCRNCMEKFLELIEVRDYLKGIGEETPEPIVLIMGENKPQRKSLLPKIAIVAASILLAISIGITSYQIKRIEKAEKRIAMASTKLEREIEEVSYKTEKTARDNYMLIMGLKNYIDTNVLNNQNTRRASYEKF